MAFSYPQKGHFSIFHSFAVVIPIPPDYEEVYDYVLCPTVVPTALFILLKPVVGLRHVCSTQGSGGEECY